MKNRSYYLELVDDFKTLRGPQCGTQEVLSLYTPPTPPKWFQRADAPCDPFGLGQGWVSRHKPVVLPPACTPHSLRLLPAGDSERSLRGSAARIRFAR